MTKTKLYKIGVALFCILTLAALTLGFSGIKADAADTEPVSNITAATDVYWMVSGDKLLLSSEQGNTGLAKWSKESVASVTNASHVPWNSKRNDIKEIRFYGAVAPTSCAFWFTDMPITSFSSHAEGILYFDMQFVTNAERCFAGCTSLTSLDLSGVKAPKVSNIESIFDGCAKLGSIDISAFDGAPLTNMMNAFYGCAALTSLDVSGLNTSRVSDFTGVFYGCAALTTLDLTELDCLNITNLENTFNGCKKLTTLTFGEKFDCAKVTAMENTFKYCSSLTELDISRFNTSKVTNMAGTFSYCTALKKIIFGDGFTLTSVTDMDSTFTSCSSLTELDTSGWNGKNVTTISRTFSGCSSLSTLNLSGFWGAKPTKMDSTFASSTSLVAIDLSGIDTSGVTSLYRTFAGCSALVEFDLKTINTSAVTRMDQTFENCTSLTSFSFNGVNTSSVTTMYCMFENCTSLTSIDFGGIDSAKVQSMGSMLYNCKALTVLDLTDLDLDSITTTGNFIRGCTNLEKIIAPRVVPASATIDLGLNTYYDGNSEISEITSVNAADTIVRKFDIEYFWKNGTQTTTYTFEPSYYYYGTETITINCAAEADGYVFEGWTRKDSGAPVTEITSTDTGNIILYAKMTPYKPITPVIESSDDAVVTYGEGYGISVSFTEEELHTYTITWYIVPQRVTYGGTEVTGLRNKTGFTVDPKRFDYGVKIEEDCYFYCEIKAKRTDNGLTATAKSQSIRVYVERMQAEITVHPSLIEGLVYNGENQPLIIPGESNINYISYSLYEFEGFTQVNYKAKNAGVGTLYYKVADGTYHKGTETYSLEYKIEAAEPTVAWETDGDTVKYTGEGAVFTPPTVTLLGSDVYDGEISYSYTGTYSGEGLPVNAGTYTVSASIPASGNYKAATSTNTFTLVIEKIEPTLINAPEGIAGLIYTAEDITLVNAGEVSGGVLVYSLDGESYLVTLPTARGAGEYTVHYKIMGDENYLDGEGGSISCKIDVASITVSANDTTACIGAKLPTLKYTVTGLLGDDALITEPTLTADAPEAIGEYTITVSGADAGENYKIAYEVGTLTAVTHSWDGGKVTTAPTCTEKGVKTFTCQNDGNHTYTEDVDALGHSYDSVCDAECNTCNTERTPEKHADSDENGICDVCGKSTEDEDGKLSGGEIAAIIIGVIATTVGVSGAIGVGCFFLIKFIVKKKK